MGLGGRVSIYPEKKLLTDRFGPGPPNTKHHIAIPIDELDASSSSLGGAIRDKKIPMIIDVNEKPEEKEEHGGEGETDGVKKECRICQDEDLLCKLEIPCACIGSLMYAHRSCIQHWCNVRGSIRCEICKQFYSPDYTVMDLPFEDEDLAIISEPGCIIPGTDIRIYTPRELFGMAVDRISRSMNRDLDLRNPTPGVLFGLALLIFMAVMVLRDAYKYAPSREDKFNHTLYCIIMIIAVPVYVLQWIFMCLAHRERERMEWEREMERDQREIQREREREMEREHSA